MSDTAVYICDKCGFTRPKCLCSFKRDNTKTVSISESELATLRAKAEAYDKGIEAWAVMDKNGNPLSAGLTQYDAKFNHVTTWEFIGAITVGHRWKQEAANGVTCEPVTIFRKGTR